MKYKITNLQLEKLFSIQILFLCIITDITFIALHGLYEFNDSVSDYLLNMTVDRGYAEVFQYIKEYWIVGILLLIAFKNRSLLFLIWSGLFTYVLLDDALVIHETWGLAMSKALSFPAVLGLNPHDLGEIAISAIFGFSFLGLIAINYRLANYFERRTSKYLIYMLFSLGLVGIVADSLHVMNNFSLLNPILTVIEDGGEMIVMSFILAFVLLLPGKSKKISIKH